MTNGSLSPHLLVGLATTAMLLALPTAALAQDDAASIGVGVGLVDPDNIASTLWLTGNVRFRLADAIVLEPEIGYWSKTEEAFGASASIKDLSLGANLLYLTGQGAFEFGGGAGLGLHRLTGELDVLGFGVSNSETKLGLHLIGTAGRRLGSGLQIFVSARYDAVSDLNQLKLYGGVRFTL